MRVSKKYLLYPLTKYYLLILLVKSIFECIQNAALECDVDQLLWWRLRCSQRNVNLWLFIICLLNPSQLLFCHTCITCSFLIIHSAGRRKQKRNHWYAHFTYNCLMRYWNVYLINLAFTDCADNIIYTIQKLLCSSIIQIITHLFLINMISICVAV